MRLRERTSEALQLAFIVPYLFFWARLVLRIHKPVIIGITGSVGKTTTTDLVAAVLADPRATAKLGAVRKTSGNLNDDIGLPLTILGYDDWMSSKRHWIRELSLIPLRVALGAFAHYPKLLVLEYATHWKGHIHKLARLAPPTVAVVTTIGPAHLERLGTIQGVAREKVALVRATKPDGLVILGEDNPFATEMAEAAPGGVVMVRGRGVELARNIAREVARFLALPAAIVDEAFANFKPVWGRLNVLTIGPLTVIDDSFNANPQSMRLALDTLAATAPPRRRRVAILGTMAELGNSSPAYHAEIGAYARARADFVVGVGDLAKSFNPDLWFKSSVDCAGKLEEFVRPGDCLVVKGSGSMKMIFVVNSLKALAERLM